MASDESLVLLLRNPKNSPQDRDDAARTLEDRYKRVICGRVLNEVENPHQFLAVMGSLSVEAFCADVFGKACKTWRQGAGSKFSSWLYLLLTQAIVDGYRQLKKLPKALIDRDGEDLAGRIEDRSENMSPLDQLALLDALTLARACLDDLPKRSRQVFVWVVFLNMKYKEIRAIWPHETVVNLKQIKARAAAKFVERWEEKGGAAIEEAVQSVAGAVADRVDPARIRNRHAREAYLVWVKTRDLQSASKQLKLKGARLRKLLHEALNDLFEQSMIRGLPILLKGTPARLKDLLRGLELAEKGDDKNVVAQRIEHVLQFVRATFGFARPESALHTLGSLVHSRLEKVEDYDAACRELGLKPAGLRKLLADELDPERDFYDRLSQYLSLPADLLRSLPRRPAGGTRFRLRSQSGFDGDAFHERVMAWVRR